mmetsp:Transcript_33339/g.78296  ORF Transcript_33339/g.78296 Transcript_33339/m.78296 type:complete len:304 (-) Transcript_33339:670-1581(-)
MNAAIVALTLLAMLVGSVQSAVLLRRPSVRCSAARLRPSKRCPTQALMLMYSTSFRLLAGPRRRLLPSRAAPAMDALPTDTPRFRRTRMVTFVSIAVGYASYYLARNSLTYVAPVMLASLGGGRFDITTVGLITSVFSLCYGVSKFVSGVLGDRIDARTLLAGGLMLTAGAGAPACAKILTSWFASRKRGTYWGLWNLSHNIGGFSAPLLAAFAARSFGWRWGFFAPGFIGLGSSALTLCRSAPEDLGFAPVEAALAPSAAFSAKPKPAFFLASLAPVARNGRIWVLAVSYLCLYVVRQGVTS